MQICKYANSQYGMRRCRVRYSGNSFYFRISYFHACILSHLHITLAYSKVFSHAVTDYGSLLLDWHNALVGRNTGNPTNMQLELFGDGSFEWRTDDSSQLYAPVFPFDWDGDGLENSVDPEPLVAVPDAHGTNVEWYNVVCANIVNSNAYYFVDVVAARGPVPIRFNADRESLLGSPVVIARGGETNHVPLLMGVEYAVTSAEPLSLSAPSNVVVTMTGLNDGRAFNVQWPLSFDLSPDSGGYAVDVQPFDPGMPFAKIYRDLNLTNRRPLPYRSSDMLLQDQPMT